MIDSVLKRNWHRGLYILIFCPKDKAGVEDWFVCVHMDSSLAFLLLWLSCTDSYNWLRIQQMQHQSREYNVLHISFNNAFLKSMRKWMAQFQKLSRLCVTCAATVWRDPHVDIPVNIIIREMPAINILCSFERHVKMVSPIIQFGILQGSEINR